MTNETLPEDHPEISNGTFTFHGKPLERFGFDREAVAQILSNASGAFNDALLVFLCLTPIEEVRLLLDEENGHQAYRRKMLDWCDKEGITIHKENPERKEISRIANQVYADLAISQFHPEIKGGDKPSPNVTG